ncbi:MAG: hypothetical protein WAL63_18415 [Solirubrobacteraceae bacterium]
MKRRICLVGALSVCLLASVAGTALAASSTSKPSKPTTVKVSCSTADSIAIPAGETGVLPPADQGAEYGTASCGGALGGGVSKVSFTIPASGDTIAKDTLYFNTGTLYGTYDLTPQQQSSLNFLETDWTGTMKVLGGRGAHRGVTGTGTMACQTLDGIHITCTDKLKLKLPAAS